ncbi:MAG: vitamin K epoxide reductase family protein, partial [Patescibacteria group bacterium]
MSAQGATPLSVVLLVLSFLGLADAWYLTASAVNHTALSCDLGAVLDGCNIVAKSDYSFFMGLPLALYGVLFYVLVFVLAAAVLVVPAKLFYQGLLALGAVGSL